MKQWGGIDDGMTEVGGDGLSAATGVSWVVEGELRRRPGMAHAGALAAQSLAHLRTVPGVSWVLGATAAGAVSALKLSDASLTSLASGYNVEQPWNWAVINQRLYLTNDFDRVQAWDGVWSALRESGIAAPTNDMGSATSSTAGNITTGSHLLRYRYLDSASPGGVYRSNPSGVLTVSVTSAVNGSLTFSIGTGSEPIKRSTDAKVDRIVVEMTAAGGSVYYEAATALNSASSVTVNMSDTTLAVQNLASTYDETGHEQPPLGSVIFESRGYTFVCGTSTRTRTVGVTSSSTSVTGSSFSTLWAGRLIRFGSETRTYVISSATATTITLAEAYVGSTATVSATVLSSTPNRAYWSRNAFPESYKGLTRARDVLAGVGDRVVGGADFVGDAWFFGLRSMARLVYVDDPAEGEVVPVPGVHGLWNQRCLVSVDGLLYGWGPNGMWQLTGGRARWMSRAVDASVAADIDRGYSDLFHGFYDPVERFLRWVYVGSGETSPRHAITYDLTNGRWSCGRTYRQGVYASALAASDAVRMRAVVACPDQTRVWYHDGATDGVPASSSGAYTAASGSTTTVTNVADTLPTGTGTDLSGAMLYRPATAEEKAITSNTVSAITHAAFATACANGEAVYAGSIPWEITTDWWTADAIEDKKRPHLYLQIVPQTEGTLLVYVYRDFLATPHTWTSTSSDTWGSGVTLSNNRQYLEVALTGGASGDGFLSLPMPAEWSRALRARVVCLSPAGTLKLLDLRFILEARRDHGAEAME